MGRLTVHNQLRNTTLDRNGVTHAHQTRLVLLAKHLRLGANFRSCEDRVSLHTHTRARWHARKHARTHAQIHTHTHTHTHIHARKHSRTPTRTRALVRHGLILLPVLAHLLERERVVPLLLMVPAECISETDLLRKFMCCTTLK